MTPSQFDALAQDEQLEMLAFTRFQDVQANEFREMLIERQMLEPAAATALVIRSL